MHDRKSNGLLAGKKLKKGSSLPKLGGLKPRPKTEATSSDGSVEPALTVASRSAFAMFEVEREEQLVDLDAGEDEASAVVVRTPHRQLFVRAQPKPVATVYLLRHQAPGDLRPTLYLTTPAVAELLPDDVAPYWLFLWIDREGHEGLWPIRAASSNAFATSELRAVAVASRHWARIVFRKIGGFGERVAVKARADLGEPNWSARTRDELLSLAFGERTIADEDHPIVVELLGGGDPEAC